MTETIRLDLPLLLPDMEAGDKCVDLLTDRLNHRKGIQEAHIVRQNGTALLCVHYDPNLISLRRVQRFAERAGAAVTDRYRHEQIPFTGLDAADGATAVTHVLEKLPGMLHAHVNYAAGLVFVAYDSTLLDRPTIDTTLQRLGVRIVSPAAIRKDVAAEPEAHDHGGAPAFLPHWIQERWALILVGLAGLCFLAGWAGEQFLGLPPALALPLFILAYLFGGYEIATHAIPGLLRAQFDTDALMLAAAVGAAMLGQWSEGAFLLFLFSLAHAGEHYALDRARNAVNALGALMPQTARVKRGGHMVEVNIAEVQPGDVVVICPGDRLPVDGKIVLGRSVIDQSPITGESLPVEKGPGNEVFAGTINGSVALEVEVTRLARDNTLSRVMRLVAEAQSQQSATQDFTQRFTARFVPGVLAAAVLVMVAPPLMGWLPLSQSFYRAMLLLVAASPCALALGAPATVLAGIAQAARNGVLIKGGVHLENLGSLKVMAFDKTGTLTEGRLTVTDVVPLNRASPDEVLRLAAAVEKQSSHPLAQAVVRLAQEKNLDVPTAEGLENIAGRGVRSAVNGQPILLGSIKLFRETGGYALDPATIQAVERLEQNGRSTIILGQNGQLLGVLGLADRPRAGIEQTMEQLRQLGLQRLVMLTGDHPEAAQRLAGQVGVTDIRAGLLPEDKLKAIQALQAEFGAIAMTGDGVNDAPALAVATVGIAMGGAGTAVALETADVALMADDLSKLPFAVGLSRASQAIIRQNLAISLGVIGLLLMTSVFGLVQLSGAVVAHEGSTILVVLNALRLLGYRSREVR